MVKTRALRVTAHLVNGYVSADDWTPALDGILAWAMLRRDCPEVLDVGVIEGPPLEPQLPLLRLGKVPDWYYACSSPLPLRPDKHVIHYHKRFDDQHAEHLDAGKRRKMNVASGRYKSYRLSGILRVTPSVTWYAIGEPELVRELLELVAAIGEKRAHGYGVVTRWEVEARRIEGDEESTQWCNLAEWYRPLVAREAAAYRSHPLVMTWGIRPPAWYRGNQRLCAMPDVSLATSAADDGGGEQRGGGV